MQRERPVGHSLFNKWINMHVDIRSSWPVYVCRWSLDELSSHTKRDTGYVRIWHKALRGEKSYVVGCGGWAHSKQWAPAAAAAAAAVWSASDVSSPWRFVMGYVKTDRNRCTVSPRGADIKFRRRSSYFHIRPALRSRSWRMRRGRLVSNTCLMPTRDFMVLTKTAVHLLRALNTAVRIISSVDWCCNVTFMSPCSSGVTSTICACVEQALTIVYIVTY